jgi:hypothetical protein
MPAARRLHNLARTLSTAAASTAAAPSAATPSAPAVRCVVACGRGRDICAPAIRDTIVSLAQRHTASSAPPRMLYLGTPAFEAPDALELQTAGFAEVGCPISELQLTDLLTLPSAVELREAIDGADIIAVSGEHSSPRRHHPHIIPT